MRASPSPVRGRLLLLVALALLLYVVVPQIGSFSASLEVLRRAETAPIGVALLCVVASYALAATVYQSLGLKRLRYGRTLAVQGATAFANRLLPAGLGGLTVNVQYLRRQKYPTVQALGVAATANALGMVGHGLILATLLVMTPDSLTDVQVGLRIVPWQVAAGVVVLLALVLAGVYWRRQLRHALGDAWRYALAYRSHTLRLGAALVCSIGITLLYAAVLYYAGQAVNAGLTFAQVLVVSTIGIALGTATPTPGGLGGLEAGLVAGSIAYGVNPATALAVALLYRLLTYWLPIIPGIGLFLWTRNRYL